MSNTYSAFEYLYRDASNYKVYAAVLLDGRATANDRARVEARLTAEGGFIPQFVGLKPLQAQLDGFPSSDDHIWHEYAGIREAVADDLNELVCWGTVQALVEQFSALPEWTSKEMLVRIGLLLEQERFGVTR